MQTLAFTLRKENNLQIKQWFPALDKLILKDCYNENLLTLIEKCNLQSVAKEISSNCFGDQSFLYTRDKGLVNCIIFKAEDLARTEIEQAEKLMLWCDLPSEKEVKTAFASEKLKTINCRISYKLSNFKSYLISSTNLQKVDL